VTRKLSVSFVRFSCAASVRFHNLLAHGVAELSFVSID
jgi:hypothetical protein